MTCIVGIAEGGKVYIGGDSAGVCGMDIAIRADRKIFKNQGFVMGFTSSFRMGQLLCYKFSPPPRHPDEDVMGYMVTKFIDGVRDCFKDGGYARKVSEVESGGQFLVGYEGRLFSIEGDYQIGETMCGYHAVGCGADYAKGSLFATMGEQPEKRLDMALRAAAAHSAGVCGPFYTETL